MKKKLYSLLILILLFIFAPNVYADYESVDPSLKVYDFAERLTDSEEKALKYSIESFTNKYNLDLVMVVKNNYMGTLKTYAEDFYDYNNFGIGKTHDGIMVVLNYDSYGIDCYILTTGQGILMYDDARINTLKSSMSAAKNEGTLATLSVFISAAESMAKSGIPASNKDYYINSKGDIVRKKTYPLGIPIVSLVVTVVVILILLNKNKMIKQATLAREYLDKSSVNITNKSDVFINTHTSKVSINTSSGGSGSSTSRGSSGTSHGGGGGRL